MQDLGTLRADQTGNSLAYGVSADGKTVVGYADSDFGPRRAFIWRTQIQDFANLNASFPILANDAEIAMAQQQAVVGQVLTETCLAGAGQACLRVGGWLANTRATEAQNIGSRRSGIATLTYGRGLDGQFTLGGTVSISHSTLNANVFSVGTGVGVSLWGEYSEGGLARTGLQAGAALGWGRESATIVRGQGFSNVMVATGDAALQTVAARATIGYGFEAADWLITPSATLAHFRTSRSAYTETGSDFNATNDNLAVNRTTAILEVLAERRVSEQAVLSLGLGVEHDISADRVVMTGTSGIPGLQTFAVASTLERRRTRGFLNLGYTHEFDGNRTLSASVRVGQAAFGTEPQVILGVQYGIRF
jgi:probable HAF family extracellular repeat protein